MWNLAAGIICVLGAASAMAQDNRGTPASPIGSQAGWFPQDDYPAEAKRAHQQGKVAVRLAVNKEGLPTSCTVVLSSGSKSLDDKTCELALANARFNPARDARGKPVASSFTSRNIVWRIEGGSEGMEISNGTQDSVTDTVVYEVDSSGAAYDCKSLDASSALGNPCSNFVAGTRIIPPIVSNGKPVSAKVTITLTRNQKIEPTQ